MPIVRNSAQKSQTLEEFYLEDTTDVGKERAAAMLSFIAMVNQTFKVTTLYGLTSLYRLIIQKTDDWQDNWYVQVYYVTVIKKFIVEYQMPDSVSPWKGAVISGEASSIEEARDYLIIAMIECEGWEDNKELRKLYNKLKQRPEEATGFTLWLEFEHIDMGNWDMENEFCNIHVELTDGRRYGLNVWTYKYLETAIDNDRQTGNNLNGLYQTPPDLFVKELTRNCIEETIKDLLKQGGLEKVLNPSIYLRNRSR
jgi:hypothetical protein